jgi:hypothetical protein
MMSSIGIMSISLILVNADSPVFPVSEPTPDHALASSSQPGIVAQVQESLPPASRRPQRDSTKPNPKNPPAGVSGKETGSTFGTQAPVKIVPLDKKSKQGEGGGGR